jgi:hypothetical protein
MLLPVLLLLLHLLPAMMLLAPLVLPGLLLSPLALALSKVVTNRGLTGQVTGMN